MISHNWEHNNYFKMEVTMNKKIRHLLFRIHSSYVTFYRMVKGAFDAALFQCLVYDMFVTHFIIIIKLEASTFPIVIISFHGCVADCTIIYYIHTYIHIFFNFDALVQGSEFESKGDKLSSSGETRIRNWAWSQAPNLQQTEGLLTNRLSYRWPVPMMSKYLAHLAPLPELVQPWLTP